MARVATAAAMAATAATGTAGVKMATAGAEVEAGVAAMVVSREVEVACQVGMAVEGTARAHPAAVGCADLVVEVGRGAGAAETGAGRSTRSRICLSTGTTS